MDRHSFRSKKILKPDVPPPIARVARQGFLVASISVLCVTAVIALALLVLFRS
ncbi:MAG TPA: hypothetical protein VFU31_11465 [Candidatus Binatia bacterium]|nr:hypothetical protein [Candidatus Binatia bacterium]